MTAANNLKSQAIIYNRVSTPEQAQLGYSLEAQKKANSDFAVRNDLTVGKIFEERGESAKTTDRTELKKLIKFAVENHKRIAAIIIWRLDRLARNLYDQMGLIRQFEKLGIRVLSTTETNSDDPESKLMRNIIGSFSQYENDVKRVRTISGMTTAISKGRWCWPYPTGYKSARDEGNKPIAVPDDEAKYIPRCFELFIEGNHHQTNIVRQLHSEGFKRLSKTHLNKIFRNPFYAGIIRHKWLEEDVEGLHKPLISKEVYFKVQEILDGKKTCKLKRLRQREDFPLKGLLLCPACGHKLTAGWSRGRHGAKYGYYHCPTKGCSVNLRKETLELIFPRYLQSIQPKSDYLDCFAAILQDTWKTRQEAQLKEKKRLENEIRGFGEKIKNLDGLLSKGLDLEDYKRNIDRIKNDIIAKRITLGDLKVDVSDFEECVQYCKFFLTNTAKLWEEGDLTQRQRFQNLIFPAGITFEGESFRTNETALIFNHFQVKPRPSTQW